MTALMQSLADSFPGSTLNAQWGDYGTVTVGGGECAVDATTSESGIYSAASYVLTGSCLFARVTPYTGGSGPYAYLQGAAATGNGGAGLQYNSGSLLGYTVSSAGAQTTLGTITYSPALHAWWQVREYQGNTLLLTSPDGVNWTLQWSAADPIAYSGMLAQFGAGIGSGTAGNAYITAFNTAPQVTRSKFSWPFTWDSIWNMPVSSEAQYAPTGITVASDYSVNATAVEYGCTDPTQPAKLLDGALNADAVSVNVDVYVPAAMAASGVWNDCAALLGSADNDTVYQGQTLDLTAGGNPLFSGDADAPYPAVSITGEGYYGAHGGSNLSALGGTLTVADLTGTGPITHAMKVCFNGYLYYSSSGSGYTWPATTADGGYNNPADPNYYGGSNPYIVEGALLALPPSVIPAARYSDPLVRKIATAMQCYGAYIVDNTASGAGVSDSLIELNYDAASYFTGTGTFSSDFHQLLMDLQVVVNSAEATPGGGPAGSPRLAPYAPPFTDGSGAPPPVTVTSPGSGAAAIVAPAIPPGRMSPMAFQRQAWPAHGPLTAGSTMTSSGDTGAGADSGTVTASVSSGELGAGADSATAGVSVAGADSGSGADTGVSGPAVADTGTGADAGAVTATATGADAGSGTDSASVTAGVSGADAGSGADIGSGDPAALSTDTGSGADTGTVAPPPVTGAGVAYPLNPVRESAAGLDVSLHMASVLGSIIEFASTGTERLYVLAAQPGVTAAVGVSSLVLGEAAQPFPPVALTAGELYAFGPFRTSVQVPGTSTVQVTLSTAYGVQALVVQGPEAH